MGKAAVSVQFDVFSITEAPETRSGAASTLIYDSIQDKSIYKATEDALAAGDRGRWVFAARFDPADVSIRQQDTHERYAARAEEVHERSELQQDCFPGRFAILADEADLELPAHLVRLGNVDPFGAQRHAIAADCAAVGADMRTEHVNTSTTPEVRRVRIVREKPLRRADAADEENPPAVNAESARCQPRHPKPA